MNYVKAKYRELRLLNVKIIKHLYLLIISAVVFGCQSNSSTQFVNLSAINATMQIPKSYMDLKNNERFVEKDSVCRKMYINTKEHFADGSVFADSMDCSKFILIKEISSYVKIDSSSFYLIIDQERSKSSSKPAIDSNYFVGAKMNSVNGFKYIECKYRAFSKEGIEIVSKSFLVSSNNKSIGLYFYARYNQDVQPYIKTIIGNK